MTPLITDELPKVPAGVRAAIADLSRLEVERTLFQGTDPVVDRLRRHIISNTQPKLLDLQGHSLQVHDVPSSGDHLTRDLELAILFRLRSRLRENSSDSEIAACFESHVIFGIGEAETLSKVQRSFLISLAQMATLRPASLCRTADFLISHLNRPALIREFVTAQLHYRTIYTDGLERVAQKWFRDNLRDTDATILALSHGRSATHVLRQLHERNAHTDIVFPSLGWQGRDYSIEEYVESLTPPPNVSIRFGAVDAVAHFIGETPIVIAAARLIYVDTNLRMHAIVSSRAGDLIDWCRVSRPMAKIVIMLPTFRVWSQRLALRYRSYILETPSIERNKAITMTDRDYVMTECSCLPIEQFSESTVGRSLLSYDNIQFWMALICSKNLDAASAIAEAPAVPSDEVMSRSGDPGNCARTTLSTVDMREMLNGPVTPECYRGVLKFVDLARSSTWLESNTAKFAVFWGENDPILADALESALSAASYRWGANAKPVFATLVSAGAASAIASDMSL